MVATAAATAAAPHVHQNRLERNESGQQVALAAVRGVGVQRLLRASEALWYRRTFDLEAVAAASGQRRFLRFEAVDYECEVWLNEALLGYHTGGFAPFSFEVTGQERRGSNTLQVRVRDPTDGTQLRGKQSPKAHGIFYTRCSGIWQTVWMETGVISA